MRKWKIVISQFFPTRNAAEAPALNVRPSSVVDSGMTNTELNEVYILAYTAPGLCFSCLQFTPEICFTAKKSVSFQCTARPMKLDVLFDVAGLSMDEV